MKDVKNHLQNGYVYKLQEDWISDDYIIKWKKRELNETDNYLMGDLFTESNQEKNIILRHLEETLCLCNRLTKNKYLIKFHISKLL